MEILMILGLLFVLIVLSLLRTASIEKKFRQNKPDKVPRELDSQGNCQVCGGNCGQCGSSH